MNSPQSSVVIKVGESQEWNNKCKLQLYLASRHDANFHYITFNTDAAVKSGFWTGGTPEQFRQKFQQGDLFQLLIGEREHVIAKINRQTGNTMAFRCPAGFSRIMPKWNLNLDGTPCKGSEVIEVDAVVIGPTGFRAIPKERKVHPKPAPASVSAAPVTPPPLDPTLDTPTSSIKSPYPNPASEAKSREVRYLIIGNESTRIYRLS